MDVFYDLDDLEVIVDTYTLYPSDTYTGASVLRPSDFHGSPSVLRPSDFHGSPTMGFNCVGSRNFGHQLQMIWKNVRYTLSRHITLHRSAHNDMVKSEDHIGYQPPNEYTQVQRLLN